MKFTQKELELLTLLVRREYEDFTFEENQSTPGIVELDAEAKYTDFLKTLLDKLEEEDDGDE